MRYENIWYTTLDHSLNVEFLFLDLGAQGWRAYILSDINYKRCDPHRSTAANDIHRLRECQERYIDVNRSYDYVCWDRKITSLAEMKTVAAVWCEITAYYIRHGGSFPAIQQKLSAQGVI